MKQLIVFVEYYIEITMFILTILFLLLAAITIQYLQTDDTLVRLPYSQQIVEILIAIWPAFFFERLLYLIFCPYRNWRSYINFFLISLIPVLRLAARRCTDKSYIWAVVGWRLVDHTSLIPIHQRLETRIEKRFLFFGLLLSVLMIPLWGIEIFIPKTLEKYSVIYHLLNLGNAAIWALFVAEFIIMISISRNRTLYLLRHWLELLIILLPMVALARVVRLVQITGVLRILQLPETIVLTLFSGIQRLLNIYRARTFLTRMIRILTMVEFVNLWIKYKNPKRYLNKLQEELIEKKLEVSLLKKRILEMEQEIERQEEEENKGQ